MARTVALLKFRTVARLQNLVSEHKDAIVLPKVGRWKTMTDNQLWLSVVNQVGVVGGSKPAEKMAHGLGALPGWYKSLLEMAKSQRRNHLHRTLRTYGIRWASRDACKCRKTSALEKNLVLLQLHGGPKKYVTRLARVKDERARIDVVISELAFIKEKGARDWLIGIGLLENAVALDVRLMTALSRLGVDLPMKTTPGRALYQRLEGELLEKVCQPIRVSGAVLDRVLYQKYETIFPKRLRKKAC